MRLPLEERERRVPFLARHVPATNELVDRVDLLAVLRRRPEIVEEALAAVGDGLTAQADVDVVEQRVRHGVRHRLHRLRCVGHADARCAQRTANLVADGALEEALADEGVLARVDRLTDDVAHHGVHRREDVRFLRGLRADAQRLAHALAFLERGARSTNPGVGLRRTRRESATHAVALGHHAAHRPRRLRSLWPHVQSAGVEALDVEEEIRREVDGERNIAHGTRRHATAPKRLHSTEALVLGHDEVGVDAVEVVALVGAKRLVVGDAEPGEVVRTARGHVVHARLVRQEQAPVRLRGLLCPGPAEGRLSSRLERRAGARHDRTTHNTAGHERSGSGEERDLRLHGRLKRDARKVEQMPGGARREVHTALRLGLAHHGRGERLAEVAPRGVARVVARLVVRAQRVLEALDPDANRGLETAKERLRRAVEDLLHAIVRRVAAENDRDFFQTRLEEDLRGAVLVRVAEGLHVRHHRGSDCRQLVVGQRVEGVGRLVVASSAALLADAVEAGVGLPALEQVAHMLRLLLVSETNELRSRVERALHARCGRERVEAVDHTADAEDVAQNITHAGRVVLAVELLLELRERDLRRDVFGSRPALRDPTPPGVGILPFVPFERDRARHGERDRHELAANGGGLRRVRRHREHAVAGVVAAQNLPPLLLEADALLELLLRHHRGLLTETLAVEIRSLLGQDLVVERPCRRELLTCATLRLTRRGRSDLHGGNRRAFGRLSGRHHRGRSRRRSGRGGSSAALTTLAKSLRHGRLARRGRRGDARSRRQRSDFYGRNRSRLLLRRAGSSAHRASGNNRGERDRGRLCHAPEGITGWRGR